MLRRKAPLQKYGCPLYGVAWPPGQHAYMVGGGNLGIENKVVVVRCSPEGVLSEEVAKLNVGADAPYRMACHPSGTSLALGMTMGGVQSVKIEPGADGAPPTLSAPLSGFGKAAAAEVPPLKCLSFSADGRRLVLGGEDGTVRIVSWPGMQTLLKWAASESKAIRFADLSPAHGDGVLLTCDESGRATLWNADTGEEVLVLKAPPDMPRATFFRCIAVPERDGPAIYSAVKFQGKGHILRWRQQPSGQIVLEARSRGPVTESPICGFVASAGGGLLAAVTPEGDQAVVCTGSLCRVLHRRGAHMTFATAAAFSPDGRWLLSTSADASAVLSAVPQRGAGPTATGLLLLAALLILVLAAGIQAWKPELAAQWLAQLGWQP